MPHGIDEQLAIVRVAHDEAIASAMGWRSVNGHRNSVPQRRATAVRASLGDIVALIEDTCVPSAGWADGVRQAFEDPLVAAAAGPVSIDALLPGSSIALACSEYGRYHPRLFANESTNPSTSKTVSFPGLPGNNLAFRRSSFEQLQITEDGLIEGEVAAALRARGLRVVFHRDMSVTFRFADPRGAHLVTRFRHGRLYAGRRASVERAAWRVAGVLKTPLLPFVLSARALRALRLPELKSALPSALPWIVMQQTAWSAGELAGYLSGPGRALESWR